METIELEVMNADEFAALSRNGSCHIQVLIADYTKHKIILFHQLDGSQLIKRYIKVLI